MNVVALIRFGLRVICHDFDEIVEAKIVALIWFSVCGMGIRLSHLLTSSLPMPVAVHPPFM